MRDEILQTSLQQFLKHGIREMSIQKLIEPLGISTKTVYKYFKNKEELLEEALLLFHRQHYEFVENLSADHNVASHFLDLWYYAIETELKVNKSFFQDLNYYYPELARKMEKVVGEKFEKQFSLIIKRGMEQGVFRKDLIPEVAMEGLYALRRHIVHTERFKNLRVSLQDILSNTIGNYIRGLCTQEGLQELEQHVQKPKKPAGSKIFR
jgi:AcrR family transcriptional regulator